MLWFFVPQLSSVPLLVLQQRFDVVRVLRCALLVVVPLLLLGAFYSTCTAEAWALVIGVSEYADPAIVPLRFAATDAREVGQALVEHCCVPEENLTVLVNEQATREAVLSALDRISDLVGPTDNVFLYAAGHGARTPDLDGDEADGDRLDEALLLYDSLASDPQTFLLDDAFGNWMQCTYARSVVVFFDACHSGGQSRSLDSQAASAMSSFDATTPAMPTVPNEGDTLARDLITTRTDTSRAVLAACGANEMAYESRGLGHGVFTHFLVAALRDPATDLDADGAVLMDELARVVIGSVVAWGEMRSESQTPILEQVHTADIVIIPQSPEAQAALVAPLHVAGMAPLEGFFGISMPAPIPLTTESAAGAQRLRFPCRVDNGIEIPIVPGGIAPLDVRWVTADPTSGFVYAVSIGDEDASATVLGATPEPLADFAIQGGVLYTSFMHETNTLITYDLQADFATQQLHLAEALPFDEDELTGVSISGSMLSLVGWSGGEQMLAVYDLRNDCLSFSAPIAGRCLGLQESAGALYSLDAWHAFLVKLEWSEERQLIGLTFAADLNSRVPAGWLPYDPRGESESLAGFYLTDTKLLLSTRASEDIEQAELFEVPLDAPLVTSTPLPMDEADAAAPVGMSSP